MKTTRHSLKALAAGVLALCLTLTTLPAAGAALTDVTDSDWYAQAVQYCWDNGMIEDNGDGDKKVWFTESGFSNQRYWSVTDDSDAYIAEMYPRFLDAMKALDYAESIFLFRLSNCYAYNNTDFERNFGLMYSPDDPVNRGAPKPAGLSVFAYFNGADADPSALYWYAESRAD